MMRIAAFSFVFGQNIPEAMQLTMLTEQVFTAKASWRYVPDSHIGPPQAHHPNILPTSSGSSRLRANLTSPFAAIIFAGDESKQ